MRVNIRFKIRAIRSANFLFVFPRLSRCQKPDCEDSILIIWTGRTFTYFFSVSNCLWNKFNYVGFDLANLNSIPSASHCQFECQKSAACQFFIYDMFKVQCFLKTGLGLLFSQDFIISGPKFCGKPNSKDLLSLTNV